MKNNIQENIDNYYEFLRTGFDAFRKNNYDDIINLHDSIVRKESALTLINFDLKLLNLLDRNSINKYELILREDLMILKDMIKSNLIPVLDLVETHLHSNKRLLMNHKYGNEILDDKYLFDIAITSFVVHRQHLDDLCYLLPERIHGVNILKELLNDLNPIQLAIAYYANEKKYSVYRGRLFYGNSVTDYICEVLSHRSVNEIKQYIKYIIKCPCNYVSGLVGAFICLLNRLSHAEITSFIYDLQLDDELSFLEQDELDLIIYPCLKEAEEIKRLMATKAIDNDYENGISDYYQKFF